MYKRVVVDSGFVSVGTFELSQAAIIFGIHLRMAVIPGPEDFDLYLVLNAKDGADRIRLWDEWDWTPVSNEREVSLVGEGEHQNLMPVSGPVVALMRACPAVQQRKTEGSASLSLHVPHPGLSVFASSSLTIRRDAAWVICGALGWRKAIDRDRITRTNRLCSYWSANVSI